MANNAAAVVIACLLLCPAGNASAQKEWREYPSIERGWRDTTEWDHSKIGEFVVGRLMFPQARRGWALGVGGGDWRRGGTAWTVD